tara:strand:- start:16925 stop:18469 length:1545 start_codon:yes stop_codon:yes gene_type:complete
MPTKGTYTALQKLKPIAVDFGQVAKDETERKDVLYNRKKTKADAEKAEQDKLDYEYLVPVITGVDSADQGIALGIQDAKDMQHVDYKKAKNDPVFRNSAEYKVRNKTLDNYSKDAKALSDGLTELQGAVVKKANDGTLSTWDDGLLDLINGAYVTEAFKFGVTKDGGVMTHIASTNQDLITTDNPKGYVKDEKGKMVLTRVTPNEVFKGLGKFKITGDVDILKKAQEIGTNLGKSVAADVSGREITHEQTWESKIEDAKKLVKTLVGSAANPSDLSKRLWSEEMQEKSRTLTDDDMARIEEVMLTKVKPYYDVEVKKTKTFAAPKSGTDKTSTPGEGIQITKKADKNGNSVIKREKTVYTKNGKSITTNRVSYTLPVVNDPKKGVSTPKIVVDINGRPTNIERLFLYDDGQMGFEGWYANAKETGLPVEGAEGPDPSNTFTKDGESFVATSGGTTPKKSRTTYTSTEKDDGTNMDLVARGAGFNNQADLYQYLKQQRDGDKTEESSGVGGKYNK